MKVVHPFGKNSPSAGCERTSQLQNIGVVAFLGSIFVLCSTGHFAPVAMIAEEIRSGHWLTGSELQQDLNRPFSGSWTRAELRQILQDVAANRHVSIVLDRRLDPSAQFGFDTKNEPLRTGLDEFAKLAKGEISLPGNYVYLGPPKAVRQLRTLIELRKRDLASKDLKIPERRRVELNRLHTVQWHDLDSPREILKKMADSSHLTMTNLDQIPHDLWAAAVLPDVSVAEALSVVLVQFDLTFRLTDSGSAIELVAIRDQPSIERKYPTRQKPTEMVELLHQKLPNTDVKLVRSEIIVNGTVEDHEAVSRILNGHTTNPPVKPERVTPIAKRQFTFSVPQPVPVSAIMHKLEESDIHFDYNDKDLKAAGIDLEQTVQPDVTNATADEFFKSIFGPVGVEFQIERQTVKLKPKKTTTRPQ